MSEHRLRGLRSCWYTDTREDRRPPYRHPALFADFRISEEMLAPSADRRWHDTDSDVIADAMLAEGFCPRGHGPLAVARPAHSEFYAWCSTCQGGWGIMSIHHGDERVDVEVTRFFPGEALFAEDVGPAQLSLDDLLDS